MAFAKGCHLNKGQHKFTPFHIARMRGMVTAPSAANRDDSAFAPPVFDQGPTGSCEGHSSAGCTAMVFAKQGQPLPWIPSMDDLYRLARCIDRGNPNGGSLAIGHPFGATGARILSQAVKELAAQPAGTLGIVSICADGGQGTVALLEAG